MVHNEALPPQQHLEPPVAETTALTGESPQSLPQPGIPRPARTISHRHPHTADNPARPPLAQLKRGAYKERQLLAWQTGVTIFLQEGPSALRCPAWRPPIASSAWCSRSRAPSGAWLPRPQARRTWLSSCRARLTDPVLPAQVGRLHAGLVLFQDGHDLLFRMPIALHRLVLSSGPDSSSPWISSRAQGGNARSCKSPDWLLTVEASMKGKRFSDHTVQMA